MLSLFWEKTTFFTKKTRWVKKNKKILEKMIGE
jgi:hypothetical protein